MLLTNSVRTFYRNRRELKLKRGAVLSVEERRKVRVMFWAMPFGGIISFIMAYTEPHVPTALACVVFGFTALFVAAPTYYWMLEGYKRRDEIDISGQENYSLTSDMRGITLGVALVPVANKILDSWPWW